MGNSGGNWEAGLAIDIWVRKDCAEEASDKNRTLLGTELGTIHYVLVKHLSTFCLSLEILWEAELRGDRLISLV